jgi:hypothetical protein
MGRGLFVCLNHLEEGNKHDIYEMLAQWGHKDININVALIKI